MISLGENYLTFQHNINKLQWKTKNKLRFSIIHIVGRKVATF